MFPKIKPWLSPTIGFTDFDAKTPVNNIPTIPPTPWQANTSKASSTLPLGNLLTTKLLTKLAINPIAKADGMVTKPAAGVIATRPTTAPIQAPIADNLWPRILSKNTHPIAAAAAATVVVPKACAANPLDPTAEPALKPNHPNHNKPVPNNTYVILAGFAFWTFLFPKNIAPANAAQPALIWTTVPPAKSKTPHPKNNPSGCQVMWHNGAYTKTINNTINNK